jgi:hemoglobin
MFARFFVGFADDSKKRIRQHLVDFVCEKTGGPCFYTGRDMKTAHTGMGVTKEEWDKAIVLFGETLTALKVPAEESQELATLIVPFEKDIVEKP